MARPASASTPGSSKRKRDAAGEGGKSKKSHKGKGKRAFDEARAAGTAVELRKMDSPAVQRAKREIKIRRLTAEQITALEKAFDDAEGKLSHPQKVEIAKGIGLEARQVAIWFQNRRAKWRTEQVESQYDVLQKQNQRLQADNERLKKELEEARHALAAARSGIAHPTPSRMEPVAGASGAAFFGSKDGESPGSVYEKLQNLLKSMKGKRSAFLSAAAAGDDESSDSGSESSDESSEEERQPIKRAKRSALQKPRSAPAAKPAPSSAPPKSDPAAASTAKKDAARKSPVLAASKSSPATEKAPGPAAKAVPKGRLTRESSMGRPSTLQRRGSKLEALQLPVKMSPAVPLFADKDRLKPPAAEAPTPRMGRGKPGAATPGSTPSMWLGPRSDPSPTTGPLGPGEPQPVTTAPASDDSTAALLDKVPPSAIGRGFSHLLNAAPNENSPTDSTVSPSAYLLSDGKEPSPTTGALTDATAPAKGTPPKPSPLSEEGGKEARLQLAPSASDWGAALLKMEQQRSTGAGPSVAPAARHGSPALPIEAARELVRALGGGEVARSPSPSVLPSVREFPNSAAQDFLAKYRAVYGEIHRSSERASEGASKAADILAFVNGTDADDEERKGGQQQDTWRGAAEDPLDAAGLAQRLAALDGSSKGLDALAMLHLGAAPLAADGKAAGERDGLLELSLEPGSGLAAPRTAQLLVEAAARVGAGSQLPSRLARGTSFLGSASAFEAFRGGGNLLDPYQDPPFSSGLREERALSPSLRDAISQHQSGHPTQSFLPGEARDEGAAPGSSAGPLTPRLGGQVQQGIPPWLTAVANGLWGDSGSPGGQTSSSGWWTQFQAGH